MTHPSKGPKGPFLMEVHWDDAHSPGATEVVALDQLDKLHHPLHMITVGWILRDDLVGITVAGEYCGDGDYRNVTFIPRPLIRDVRALGRPRRRKTTVSPPDQSFDAGVTAAVSHAL